MKKATTYLLLVVLSVNIFGAGTGALIHWLAHALEGEEVHWHTHHHGAGHAHHHAEAHHAGHHHTHHGAITFLLDTFSAFDQEASEQCLLHLNWLMLSLTGLLSTMHYASAPETSLSALSVGMLLLYQSVHPLIPCPPPRILG
jgi:hypothetical protein